MIVFINCYEEMAVGMRMLAALAKDKGFAVHVIVLRGYRVRVGHALHEEATQMHICVNGTFHSNPCRLRNFTTEELGFLKKRLLELRPELACISTRSANDPIMPPLLATVREACPKIPIVCGGYGPTYDPALYLKNGADIVVRGEGEIPFSALLDCVYTRFVIRCKYHIRRCLHAKSPTPS